jgi:hypothetical protein
MQGDLPQEKLPNIPEGKIPSTFVKKTELPDMSKFVKDDQLATRTTSGQVKNIIKNMVKKSALQ